MSAKENRWVKFAELAGELCEINKQNDPDACDLLLIDPATGALDLQRLTDKNVTARRPTLSMLSRCQSSR
jgi:hypothetical protein